MRKTDWFVLQDLGSRNGTFVNGTRITGDTLLTPDQGPTYGSLAIQIGGTQIRQAAATARAALTSEAAKLWNVDANGA